MRAADVFTSIGVPQIEGTFAVDSMVWSKGLDVEAGGHGVVSHVGSAATRLLADRAGLTGALSGALARRGFSPLHGPGRVLADLAGAIADGATTIGEIDTLRHQGELFGAGEPHSDDFVEDGITAVDMIRGINSPNVSFLYCARIPSTWAAT